MTNMTKRTRKKVRAIWHSVKEADASLRKFSKLIDLAHTDKHDFDDFVAGLWQEARDKVNELEVV